MGDISHGKWSVVGSCGILSFCVQQDSEAVSGVGESSRRKLMVSSFQQGGKEEG